MFLAIILTLIFAVLGMTVLYLLKDNDDRANENLRLRRENAALHGRLSASESREWRRRERSAYRRGLYDGRRTDTLYRSVLKRYSAGEQITVMTDGAGEPDREE